MKILKSICFAIVALFMFVTIAKADVASPKVIAAKLYADWCTSCKIIAPSLDEVKQQYGDKDVLFVTFDRTDDKTSRSAELLASAIGFGDGYAANEGTGKVLLINAETKEVLGKLNKTHTVEDMKGALDKALKGESIMEASSGDKGSPMKGSPMEKKGS